MGNAGVLPLSSWHHIPCWELGVKKVSIFLATHAQTGVSLMLSSTVGEGDGVSGMYLTATEPCYSYQDFVSSLIICLWDHFERLSFFFFFMIFTIYGYFTGEQFCRALHTAILKSYSSISYQ